MGENCAGNKEFPSVFEEDKIVCANGSVHVKDSKKMLLCKMRRKFHSEASCSTFTSSRQILMMEHELPLRWKFKNLRDVGVN